jgi:hypothetical protein
MNWSFQRRRVKPTAKSCEWCKNFSEDFECTLNGIKQGQVTHRLVLKMEKEFWDFRYCKNYKYSKANFKRYKKMCEENAKATGYVGE